LYSCYLISYLFAVKISFVYKKCKGVLHMGSIVEVNLSIYNYKLHVLYEGVYQYRLFS